MALILTNIVGLILIYFNDLFKLHGFYTQISRCVKPKKLDSRVLANQAALIPMPLLLDIQVFDVRQA